MIIDAKTVLFTLIIVAVAFVYALKLVRRFALEIAQENHDAVTAMDQEEEKRRLKKEKTANEAADAAFTKVEPMLKISTSGNKSATTTKQAEREETSDEEEVV
mmetsp:Transcript_33536/g.79066  ORF Transcript_33536/g.79066 Transcript_33536/m.79066 type:complete len:103 (+) Transcript_33536:214-522(+)|eukprot:CAMPEP_0172396518 /NCGR_PEP_ID=MMETSP1061-20121228/25522_1 /TAXON_ID=37318 /ORGANISM="Pseudo-nitzschia pungens, Strain cf. pungens" /LENGTH=102 /DNA_ID=CAMNT_0013128389 /DNA_START=192 /DNA_END=500 /DNA_ORIENTATION=+